MVESLCSLEIIYLCSIIFESKIDDDLLLLVSTILFFLFTFNRFKFSNKCFDRKLSLMELLLRYSAKLFERIFYKENSFMICLPFKCIGIYDEELSCNYYCLCAVLLLDFY